MPESMADDSQMTALRRLGEKKLYMLYSGAIQPENSTLRARTWAISFRSLSRTRALFLFPAFPSCRKK